MRTVKFFDTTLRDGDQTPGILLGKSQKLEIARQLGRLRVDVIEAGFPASSPGDFAAVRAVAELYSEEAADAAASSTSDDAPSIPTIAALARANRADIDAAVEALKPAAKPRIHVFIATSAIHMKHKLQMEPDAVLGKIREAVSYAVSLCPDVEFSAEDAGRSDHEFLIKAVQIAAEAGAGTINIPDTVGYNMPFEFGALIKLVRDSLPSSVIVSAHCHNDLGCAVACSLEAVRNGADQLECTVNGIGERAGNAALEELAMGLYTRRDIFGCDINLDISQLARTCRLVSSTSGIHLPPNKAVVGANAFAHEAGIHQHGVMQDSRTYEIMNPETIGLRRNSLVLGKLSGRHAFAERARELGYTLDKESLEGCFAHFKVFAEKKQVTDEDIMAIINDYMDSKAGTFGLESFQIQSGNRISAVAMVTLSCRDIVDSEAAVGGGPVDAGFNAINRLCGMRLRDGEIPDITLSRYGIKAVNEGADALGEAYVRVSIAGADYTGRGVSADIIEASLKAYVNAINKWVALNIAKLK